ncbi:MAG: DUF4112 domain-containing protein [Alphaproteobacteria bacterium]
MDTTIPHAPVNNHNKHHAEGEKKIAELDRLAVWLDSKFTIPGTSFKIGFDSILGLLPVIGDTITFTSTAYFYAMASSLQMPWHIKMRILWNGFIDWLVGLIPFFGDIFDIAWKSNLRNINLLKRHLGKSVDKEHFPDHGRQSQ